MMTDPDKERYFQICQQRPVLFDNPAECPIRLLLSDDEIASAEEFAKKRLSERGLPDSWAHVGVVYEDEYILVLRDAVQFAKGSLGTYIRIIMQSVGPAGVAILPVMDGKIILVNHFRHATRQWHWEIPRGFTEHGDTTYESTKRELFEEIQSEALDVTPLGNLLTNSGLSAENVSLLMVRIGSYGQPDHNEGISEIRGMSIEAFEEMLRNGLIDDSFTIAAYTRARLSEHI